jgi:steroid delta-isomerase-like uncharacterized protein
MTADLTTYVNNLNQACNSHSIESVLRYYSPHFIGSDIGEPMPLQGHTGVRDLLERYWTAFPDLHLSVTDKIIQDSRLTIVWIGMGTHQGPIMNIPPTWRQVEVRGVSVIDVQDGLVVRGQSVWDLAGMLRHLGLLPEL